MAGVTWVMTRANPSQCPYFTRIEDHNSIRPTGDPVTTRKLSRASQIVVHCVGELRTLTWIFLSRYPRNASNSPLSYVGNFQLGGYVKTSDSADRKISAMLTKSQVMVINKRSPITITVKQQFQDLNSTAAATSFCN